MSIASAITAAQGKVAAAYIAISNKGGTLPAAQNLSNMPTAINSIPTGGSPNIQSLSVTPSTSSQTITATGGVDGYSPINVSAVTSSIDNNITAGNIKKDVTILGVTGTFEGGSTGYTEFPPYQVSNGVVARRSGALTGNEFSDVTEIADYGLYYAFCECRGLTGALDLSSLTTITGLYGMQNAFSYCVGLTSVDLSSLTTISGTNGMAYAFSYCAGLTSVNLSSLTTIGGSGMYYAFNSCTGLTSIDLSSLTTISGTNGMGYTFYNCTGLTSVNLSSLTTIGASNAMSRALMGCTNLEHVYFRALTTTSFGSYTNQFNNMLSSTGTTKTHTLHFPSNLSSKISTLTGYPTFGGTSGAVTLAYDLPATS